MVYIADIHRSYKTATIAAYRNVLFYIANPITMIVNGAMYADWESPYAIYHKSISICTMNIIW